MSGMVSNPDYIRVFGNGFREGVPIITSGLQGSSVQSAAGYRLANMVQAARKRS